MWFGQFIHGVLEESFRRYQEERTTSKSAFTPPDDAELELICDVIIKRLANQGLRARNRDIVSIAKSRAAAALQLLGPELFPLIQKAEVRLTGTRSLRDPSSGVDRYEMKGVVDVISHIDLQDPKLNDNWIVRAIRDAIPLDAPESFEVIIDYKGMRRPATSAPNAAPNFSQIYDWQLQTYAQLRSVQQDSLPVAAGILIYLNELLPSWSDLRDLRDEVKMGITDVAPAPGSPTESLMRSKRGSSEWPDVDVDFRRRRALKIVPISPQSQKAAAQQFDEVVAKFERRGATEQRNGEVLTVWEQNSTDEKTCAACDWRAICPEFSSSKKNNAPSLPGR